MTSFFTTGTPKANPALTDMTLRSPDRNPEERDLFFRPYSKETQVGRLNTRPNNKTGRTRRTNKNSRKGVIEKRMREYRREIKWCERCLALGEQALSTEVHHIDRVGMGGAGHDHPLHQKENFSALCKRCHDWAEMNPRESVPFLKSIKNQYWENFAKTMSLTRVESRLRGSSIHHH